MSEKIAPSSWLIALGVAVGALAACAAPPPIDGARCPCPDGFYCDAARGICVGGEAPRTTPTEPPTGSNPMPPIATPVEPPMNVCAGIGVGRPDRLTPTEYRFTVADLLNVTLTAAEIPPDFTDRETGFVVASSNPDVDAALRALGKTVAMRALPNLKRPTECAASLSDDACGRLFVDSFGQRAYRRPLNDADRTSLTAAFTAAQTSGGLTAGLAAVIEAALASDNFLRRRDVAADPMAKGPLVKADAWTIGSRLAALLWQSNPDEPLLAAARTGELLKPAEIEKQVGRMLQDPRAERTLTGFFRAWMEIRDDRLGAGDPPITGYTPALRAALLKSFDGYAGLVHRQDVPLATLLTTPETLADKALATFYGLVAPAGAGFEPVPPRDQQIRRGLLTTPAFLASHARTDETSPVQRGLAVSERTLCVDLPGPPPNVEIPALPEAVGTTTRDRYIQHDKNPACASCHRLMDPLGFGLENYDGVGRWRTLESGAPINAAGSFEAVSELASSPFNGPAEMIEALSGSGQTRSCYALQWFRFAFGRKEAEADQCTLKVLMQAFAGSGGRTNALLSSLARSDAFTSMLIKP